MNNFDNISFNADSQVLEGLVLKQREHFGMKFVLVENKDVLYDVNCKTLEASCAIEKSRKNLVQALQNWGY